MNRKQRRGVGKQGRVAAPPTAPDGEALIAAGLAHHRAGRLAAAEALYGEALRRAPRNADALHLAGVVAGQSGRLEAAVALMTQAVAVRPAFPDALCNLAGALRAQGRRDAAIRCCVEALGFDPAHAQTLSNLGNLLREDGRPDAALRCYALALSLDPAYPEALANRALVLREQGWPAAAAATYGRALALGPAPPGILCDFGLALQELGKPEEAIRCYAAAVRLDPACAEAHWNEATARLAAGDLTIGWQKYEWRWHARVHGAASASDWTGRPFRQPPWSGDPDVPGRRLLVWREQGIGDEIMFASCLPDLVARGMVVTLECSPKLLPLFRRSFPDVRVVAEDRSADVGRDDFDTHLPLGSLPRFVRPDLARFPERAAFLTPDPARVGFWRDRLAALGPGPFVGISWRGRMRTGQRDHHYTRLEDWAPVLTMPGLTFINMQYDEAAAEVAAARTAFGVTIHTLPGIDMWNDLDEVAALLKALDRLVTAGTAVMSLAGAVGVPTGLLWLRHVEDWPALGTDRLPWYPAVRLFARTLDQPWRTAAEQMAGAFARGWP